MSDIEEHRKKIEAITLEMIKLLKTRQTLPNRKAMPKQALA